ncbi:MAG TPA: alkaline phosphatase family protein [Candidatus Sulfotelmatobacter sp.]|nr:alkaline phosphatase family protein [Candidatus Sulfotelmatobacter sp.]
MIFKRAGRSVLAAIALLCAAVSAFAQVPTSQHVILVINENSSYNDVVNNMPWLVGEGNANGYATNYTSDNGGSLLDYLWLASGSCESKANCTLPSGTHDFNCNGNDCYYPNTTTTDAITDDNIFRELNNAGISWKVYAQSYASAGGTPTTPDNNNGTDYYRRHNGATWYSDIINNTKGSANNIVDLSELTTDLNNGNLPRFMIIVPDGNHDAHDCPVGKSSCTEGDKLSAADDFLSENVGPILSISDFQPGGTGLFIATFDECGGGTNAGCGAAVYTALIGPQVKPHTVSSVAYKHENTLRTILDSLGIKNYPGASATAADMSDFFSTSNSNLQVTVSSPKNNTNVNSPETLTATATPSAGHTITGWHVYIDSVDSYSGGAVTSISPSLSMKNGTHTVVTRAWDTSGAYADQTVTVTVSATSAKPTVTVSTPTQNATVGSPVNIQASASPTAGHTISKWWIYVDGTGSYNAGTTTTINANVSMSSGTHTVIVRAWDTSGAYGDQTLTLTVSNKVAVAVSTPTSNSRVVSPFNVQASATPTAGHSVTGWWIYLDSVGVYEGGAGKSINANVSASTGTHTLVVRAWDSSGAYGDQTFSVTVKTVAVNITSPAARASVNSPVTISANAESASSISSWDVYVDSVSSYTHGSASSINPSIKMSSGQHTVEVKAWDSKGNSGSQTITVTVP